jgi:hypothetical protein
MCERCGEIHPEVRKHTQKAIIKTIQRTIMALTTKHYE